MTITNQNDSIEKMLEQGGSDAKAKMAAQLAQNSKTTGANTNSSGNKQSGISTLSSLVDPDAWVKDLYGLPQTYNKENASRATEQGKTKGDNNHTPLDTKKLEGKYNAQMISPEHRQFFKKYNQEAEQFLHEKKKKEENEKRRNEEEEKKRKEEIQKKQAQEDQNQGTPHGKVRKSILGQGRRKATTELHPETKAGGAK